MKTKVRRFWTQIPRRTWITLLALLVALIATLPLLQDGGLLNTRGGGDSPFLLQRLHQLVSALRDGHFPVRWMPDAAYGYGYPFFNYYAPLSIYVAALFRLLGAPYTAASQLAQLSAFLLAAWATLELARRWLRDDWAALLASGAYTLAPFHLVNVYVRGDSLAEFWAMALYPLVLLAADHLLAVRQPPPPVSPSASATPCLSPLALALPLALAYAALVLTHNISALIFTPFLLLYILIAVVVRRSWPTARRALFHAAFALALGLLLSAWFWLPALAETNLVQTDPVTAGYFHFANHFRDLDLVQSSLLFDWDVAGQSAFRMGLLQALLILAGLVAFLWASQRQHPAGIGAPPAGVQGSGALWERPQLPGIIFVVVALIISTFMITPLSRWLWEAIPLLPYTQFPWRFLSIQALAGALVSGALVFLPGRRIWLLVGILVLLAAMLPSLQVDHLAIADADVTPLRLAQYEWFTGNIGTTVSAEYLPQTVQPRPYTSPWLTYDERNQAQLLSGAGSARLLLRRATRQIWQVQVSGGSVVLELPTIYWPGWQARVDGQPLPISPAPGSGLIAVELPEGVHTVQLALGRTPVRLAAELISLVTFVILAIWGLARRSWQPLLASFRRRRRVLFVAAGLLLLLVLYWRLRPVPDYEQQTLSWDFAQLGYLHHAPEGIAFDDGAHLARYDYSASTIVAGETLQVALEWDAVSSTEPGATLALLTPAVHRYEHAPELVSARNPLRDGRRLYELLVPANAPPGLYVLRLERGGAQSLTPAGQTRGPLFLSPLRIVTNGAEAQAGRPLSVRVDDVLLPSTVPALDSAATRLFDCATRSPSPGALLVQLAWFTEQPLSANYVASLRLNGAEGERIAQCDVQPGYGFLPSGGWPSGAWIPDWLALPLPPSLPPSSPYTLLVTLYGASGNPILTQPLGQLRWQDETLRFTPHEPQFTLPSGVELLDVRFGESIALRGYQLAHSDGALHITLYWQALQDGPQAFVRFAHLLHDADGAPLAQQDDAPQYGAYPTSQWSSGEIVADTIILDASGLALDDLLLAVGFYPPQDPTARLPAYDAQGNPLPDGRYLINP